MKKIVSMTFYLLVLSIVFTMNANSENRIWQVSGEIYYVKRPPRAIDDVFCAPFTGSIRMRTRFADPALCPHIGLQTSSVCPWGPWWGIPENISRNFSKSKHFPIDGHIERDFQLQYKTSLYGSSWRSKEIMDSERFLQPNNVAPNAFEKRFNLDDIVLRSEWCDLPTTWGGPVTPNPDDPDNPDNPDNPKTNIDFEDHQNCLYGTLLGNTDLRIDLRIVSANVWPRSENSNQPWKVNWSAVVINDGPTDYLASPNDCQALVDADFPSPNLYIHSKKMRDKLESSGTVEISRQGSTEACGKPDESDETKCPVIFVVDAKNVIRETDETNNKLEGCYDVLTETFVPSPCP